MIISEMELSDIEGVYSLECECFSKPWSLDGIKSELDNKNAHFYVAKDNQEVVGYVGSYIILDECTIANIAVTKSARNKGVATALLNKIIEVADDFECSFVTLEVRKSNESAIALYNKFLFKNCGVRKNFYDSPKEDGVIMTKVLKEEEVN